MKILYVGELDYGSTSGMRMRALRELGHTVETINTSIPIPRDKWRLFLSKVRRKLRGPEDLVGANRAILEFLEQQQFDVLYLNKTMAVTAETLQRAKSLQPGCLIVGYTSDDMCARHNQSRQFLEHLHLYDIYFTMDLRGYDREGLLDMGCPRVEFTGTGFDIHTHRPMELKPEEWQRYGTDVGFIGSYEPTRAGQMTYLAQHGIPIQIFGAEWGRMLHPHQNLRLRHAAVMGEEYSKVICATKINLCFLRRLNQDKQTQRSVEIPACGGFMLGERTDAHLALFEQGKEAEFFESNEELLDKTRFYLKHDAERERIAAAGRERCLKSGYSYHDRMREIMRQVAECLNTRKAIESELEESTLATSARR